MGWNWGYWCRCNDVSAAGDGTSILAHYTFNVGYEILDGLTTSIFMTPDAVADLQIMQTLMN